MKSEAEQEELFNEQVLSSLKELHEWVYRNVEWGCLPVVVAKAGAVIAAAEATKTPKL